MTELRRRMDDDMVVRGMAKRTREAYLAAVTALAKHYRRSPDQISDDEVQAYLLHLIRDRHRSWNTCHIVVHGLRFLYHTTLKREPTTFSIPTMRQPVKLPVIVSREDVERVMAHTPNLKHRTMLLTTYAAGLRLNEVLHLRVTDIDSARMTIRVEQGKGGKDRYTVLSAQLLEALAPTGVSRVPRRGCFRRRVTRSRWIRPPCNGPMSRPSAAPGSRSPAAFTDCVMPLRRTCSKPASTFTPLNGCSAIVTSARRPAICS